MYTPWISRLVFFPLEREWRYRVLYMIAICLGRSFTFCGCHSFIFLKYHFLEQIIFLLGSLFLDRLSFDAILALIWLHLILPRLNVKTLRDLRAAVSDLCVACSTGTVLLCAFAVPQTVLSPILTRAISVRAGSRTTEEPNDFASLALTCPILFFVDSHLLNLAPALAFDHSLDSSGTQN
jgi:hypothetical protein